MSGGSLGQNKWPRSEWRVAECFSGRRPALSLMASSESQWLLCNSLSAALSAPAPQVVIFGVYSLSFPSGSSVESSGNQAWLLRGDESPAVVQEALETQRLSLAALQPLPWPWRRNGPHADVGGEVCPANHKRGRRQGPEWKRAKDSVHRAM